MYHSSKNAYERFQKNSIFADCLRIFLEKKIIFAKGAGDFYRAIRPSP